MAWEGVVAGALPSFVGRSLDLARLDSWIRRARLITLVGAPGVGKTTLALEQARRAAPRVAFCDLTEATDVSQLGAILARVLDAPALAAQMGPDIVEPIGALLASRGPMLVVLDNFEQLLAHAAIVERWVELAPEARFLVTSRQRLGTVRECAIELEPLAVPAPGEEARDSDGVRLFVQRARAARRGYVLTDADEPIVAAIVRELDGLPLAIELAASRMLRLSPAQILAEIGDGFRLLAEAASPPLARGTLWRVVESAFDALGAYERTALAQCSVFRGGFDAEAAVAVVELPAGAPPVVDVVRTLVDKSLLRQAESRAEPQVERFGMLLSIREYAAHRLEVDGLTAATQQRHATHFVSAGRHLSLLACGPNGASVRRRIALDTDNLLAVHRRAIAEEPRTPEASATACRVALTLASTVVLGRLPLCLDVIEAALAEGERVALPPALHGRVLECHAWLSWFAGRIDECAESASRAVLLAEAGGASRLLGHSLAILAKARLATGRVDDARALVERALAVHKLDDDAREEGRCLALLADVVAASGDDVGAITLCEQALALHRMVRDGHDEGETLARLGDLALGRGRMADARRWYEEALLRHESVGNGRACVATRARIARCEEERGEHAAPKTPAPSPRLVVCTSGRWFRLGDGDRIDLGRRRALRLIVQRLADARAATPNTALSADDLVDVGWPGERLVAQTGADRLYTALSTLRKMGLRSVLESRDDGYLFDPRRPFERVDEA